MKFLSLLMILSLGVGCGKQTKTVTVEGKDGYTTFITTEVVPPMQSCGSVGGIKLVPYTDYNRNEQLDAGEATTLAASVICNGAKGDVGLTGETGPKGDQGIPGLQGLVGETGAQGIPGVPGAQGVAGPKGDQGLQGIQGIPGPKGDTGMVGATGPKGEPGIQGIPGSSASNGGVTPVKLCANDNSAFPEYGFMIGSSLYAVYYGVINGTLNSFMARLNPGTYMSTNSTNCTFTYHIDPHGNQFLNNVAITPMSQGLSVAVHNLPDWNNVTLPSLFLDNPTVGTFVLQNLNVGDSPSSAGFPGMPAAIRTLVGDTGYSLDINGYLDVPTTGDYKFKLTSDDGVKLLINDQLIISDDSLHAPKEVTSQTVRLNRGLNRINVVYYQGPHSQIALRLKWSGPNLPEAVVPATALSH